MAKIIEPLFEKGYFESLSIDRNRLYSQILDDLNKSALIGFPYDSFAAKLKSAWIGEESQRYSYDQAQEAAVIFRQYCLENNLLDFSLQVEIFVKYLWKSFLVTSFLRKKFKYLVFDNIEEESPVCHDVIREWLPSFTSALLIFDEDAGYRTFLGADPISALTLSTNLNIQKMTGSFVMSPAIGNFFSTANAVLHQNELHGLKQIESCFTIESLRFVPEMSRWVADEVERLVDKEKVNPSEIAIFAVLERFFTIFFNL